MVFHTRHLQQIHWSKLLCWMYGFTAKSSISILDICKILMRFSFLPGLERELDKTNCLSIELPLEYFLFRKVSKHKLFFKPSSNQFSCNLMPTLMWFLKVIPSGLLWAIILFLFVYTYILQFYECMISFKVLSSL